MSQRDNEIESVIDWKEYIIPSGHKTNLVNLANTRDTAKVWYYTNTKLVIATP
jgi:hypothetical protein